MFNLNFNFRVCNILNSLATNTKFYFALRNILKPWYPSTTQNMLCQKIKIVSFGSNTKI